MRNHRNCGAVGTAFVTHKVTNQPPGLVPYDAWASDLPLRDAITREGGGWGENDIAVYGAMAGGALMEAGRLANEYKPKLIGFDRYGHRLDEVAFHPAYHQLMAAGVRHGVSNYTWRHADNPTANVVRMAVMYLHNQADQGTCCPLSMTYASVPVIRQHRELARSWLPRVIAADYDPRSVPAWEKVGNTIGMGLTEKQGGSDLRANTTHALAVSGGGPGKPYTLVGHKWFYSAPMCDAHLVLAGANGGISCFLLPRYLPDGALNAVHVQRLKDKLGDWSNASVEVEFQNALAWLVGEEGRGIASILEMVALTRQDCMIGSCAIMRQALVQAIHHARYRKAFGKYLIKQPLMKNVLADLALESEAHVAFAARVARAVGMATHQAGEKAFARVATAIGKYWVCRRAVPFVNEAQECLGGAGYVEDCSLSRLYRQAPLNSIWEGCGNIQCLDVLRALSREQAVRHALLAELEAAKGAHRALDAEVKWLKTALDHFETLEIHSRMFVERAALALECSILLRSGNGAVGQALCESRLDYKRGQTFGTLPAHLPLDALIDRAFPPPG